MSSTNCWEALRLRGKFLCYFPAAGSRCTSARRGVKLLMTRETFLPASNEDKWHGRKKQTLCQAFQLRPRAILPAGRGSNRWMCRTYKLAELVLAVEKNVTFKMRIPETKIAPRVYILNTSLKWKWAKSNFAIWILWSLHKKELRKSFWKRLYNSVIN